MYGIKKQFGAIVSLKGQYLSSPCQEGQTLGFNGHERSLVAE
ncbi:hypothetical protein [Telluria antibiotica]|nr:hypothetical protein [Telluria antibiotica]